MAKDSTDVFHDAEQLEQKADQLRGTYLRAHGWEYTSSTPNCYWMWCKVWRGKQWTYHGSADALRAEAWMVEMGEPDAGVSASDHQSTSSTPTDGKGGKP